jgi:hypothetical protein
VGSGKIARLKVLDFDGERALEISGFGSQAATAVPLTGTAILWDAGEEHESGSDAGLTAIVGESERLVPHVRNG